jgi:hypothetical protein
MGSDTTGSVIALILGLMFIPLYLFSARVSSSLAQVTFTCHSERCTRTMWSGRP